MQDEMYVTNDVSLAKKTPGKDDTQGPPAMSRMCVQSEIMYNEMRKDRKWVGGHAMMVS